MCSSHMTVSTTFMPFIFQALISLRLVSKQTSTTHVLNIYETCGSEDSQSVPYNNRRPRVRIWTLIGLLIEAKYQRTFYHDIAKT